MASSPAFSFYAKDFLTGTATMSLAEVGAYVKLLAYQWDSGAVPSGAKERARVLGCTAAEERRIWSKLVTKFAFTDDAFQNARLETERKKQADFRELQRIKGLASARNRKSTVSPTEDQPSHQPEAQPKPNSSLSSSSSFASSDVPSKNDGTRPLVSGQSHPKSWGKKHGEHVAGFCDWVCLPEFIFAEFTPKSKGPEYVKDWAAKVRERWEGQDIGDNLKFWRDRWAESHTTTSAPKSPVIQKTSTANPDAVQQARETRRRRAEMEASGFTDDEIEAVFEREYEQRKAASA